MLMIKINGGDIFEGTVEQFRDCFFDNAYPDVIIAWAEDNNFSVELWHAEDDERSGDVAQW